MDLIQKCISKLAFPRRTFRRARCIFIGIIFLSLNLFILTILSTINWILYTPLSQPLFFFFFNVTSRTPVDLRDIYIFSRFLELLKNNDEKNNNVLEAHESVLSVQFTVKFMFIHTLPGLNTKIERSCIIESITKALQCLAPLPRLFCSAFIKRNVESSSEFFDCSSRQKKTFLNGRARSSVRIIRRPHVQVSQSQFSILPDVKLLESNIFFWPCTS